MASLIFPLKLADTSAKNLKGFLPAEASANAHNRGHIIVHSSMLSVFTDIICFVWHKVICFVRHNVISRCTISNIVWIIHLLALLRGIYIEPVEVALNINDTSQGTSGYGNILAGHYIGNEPGEDYTHVSPQNTEVPPPHTRDIGSSGSVTLK